MFRWIKENKGKILGGLSGFLFALILIFAWPIILMATFVLMGIVLGAFFDVFYRIRKWLEKSIYEKNSNEKS